MGVLSIPHSGEVVPEEFKELLIEESGPLNQDVDTAVDQLVDITELTRAGIAVIKANIHRVCVDLNRAKDVCVLNWRQNSQGVPLIKKDPGNEEVSLLTQKYYAPYYEMIKALMNELQKSKARPSFIDLHSMPSKPTEYHLKINPRQEMERPDFCLSDIEGQSCAKEFIDFAAKELSKAYPKVYQNNPYFGGHVTRHVNAAFPASNNIQIEIKRGIYLDEAKRALDPPKVQKLKPVLTKALIKTFQEFS